MEPELFVDNVVIPNDPRVVVLDLSLIAAIQNQTDIGFMLQYVTNNSSGVSANSVVRKREWSCIYA